MRTKRHKPPSDLTAAGKRLWRDIAGEIEIDTAAAVILNLLCREQDRYDAALSEIRKHGAVQVDRFGQQKVSPWTTLARDSALSVQRCFHSLGLDLQAPGAER